MPGFDGRDPYPVVAQWATEKDWVEFRDMITELYLSSTLRALKEHMEVEHNFRATDRMYKRRFGSWGLDKNIKGSEALAIWRMKLRRDEQGKDSEFFLRGKPVALGRVERHVKSHKATAVKNILRQGSDTANDLESLVCRTPSPERLELPRGAKMADDVLRLTRDYYDGSFRSARWKVGNSFEEFVGRGDSPVFYKRHDMLFDFAHHFRQANDLLDVESINRNDEAFTLLRSCFGNLPRLLSYQNPTLLNFLLSTALEVTCFHGRPDLTKHLFWCVCEYSTKIHGRNHPLALMANRVLELIDPTCKDSNYQFQVLSMMEKFTRDGFEEHLSDNPTAIFELHNNGLALTRKALGPENFVVARRALVARPEAKRISPMVLLKTQFHLAHGLYHQKEYKEAEQWVDKMFENPVLDEFDLTWTRGEVNRLSGRLNADAGRFEEAKKLIWKASAIFDEHWPLGDGNQIRLLNDKEWLLRTWDRNDEADEVQRERERRVKGVAVEAEIMNSLEGSVAGG
ncbi:hypothetical protein BJ170DRAFT_328994 [Xylariales sp. AK1849]|nr:hypothetical protein BJ170DRAFT_328994 [Xylariales sp. AK1849]